MQRYGHVCDEIARLPPDLTKYIRSTSSISTVAQCTEELVHNALDAGSSCIAIRIDMTQLKVQVIDNGEGLSKKDLEKVGSRFMTSKCRTFNDLEKGGLCTYGYRGEAIANIRAMASILQIVSKKKSENETWTVLFARGKRKPVKVFYENRQCSGTTVTVVDFMYNLPVRKRMINPTLDMQEILQAVTAICLANPSTSFTLKNEASGDKILQTSRQQNSKSLFQVIYGQDWNEKLIDVNKKSGKLKLTGFIGKNGCRNSDKQFIYVNKRYIKSSRLHKIVVSNFKKSIICRPTTTKNIKERAKYNAQYESPSKAIKLYPIYCIELELPFFECDISFGPRKNEIEFQSWDKISLFISNSIDEVLSENNLLLPSAKLLEYDGIKHTNSLGNNKARQALQQFSMSGIEPLETTIYSEPVSDINEGSSHSLTNPNELINFVQDKALKKQKVIGTEELNGARQCLPVFKPKNNINKITSSLKIAPQTFPISSTPNGSLYSGQKSKNIASFFRQTKDKYYIDEKGVFKKADLRNISKNINFKAMHKKYQQRMTPISSPNDSRNKSIDTSKTFGAKKRCIQTPEIQRIESSCAPKESEDTSYSSLHTSLNNIEDSTVNDKLLHLNSPAQIFTFSHDMNNLCQTKAGTHHDYCQIEKSSGYSSHHSIDSFSDVDDMDCNLPILYSHSNFVPINSTKDDENVAQHFKLPGDQSFGFHEWITSHENDGRYPISDSYPHSERSVHHYNSFVTPYKPILKKNPKDSLSDSCQINSENNLMSTYSLDTLSNRSWCYENTSFNSSNTEHEENCDLFDASCTQYDPFYWKLENNFQDDSDNNVEVGLSFSYAVNHNVSQCNKSIDVSPEKLSSKRKQTDNELQMNYVLNDESYCLPAESNHDGSLYPCNTTIPFSWLHESESEDNLAHNQIEIQGSFLDDEVNSGVSVPSSRSVGSVCISILNHQIEETHQIEQRESNNTVEEISVLNSLPLQKSTTVIAKQNMSPNIHSSEQLSVSASTNRINDITTAPLKMNKDTETGGSHNSESSNIGAKETLDLTHNNNKQTQENAARDIKDGTGVDANVANFNLFENTVNKPNHLIPAELGEWVLRTNDEGKTFNVHLPSGQIAKSALITKPLDVTTNCSKEQISSKGSACMSENAPKRVLWPLPAGKSPFLSHKRIIANCPKASGSYKQNNVPILIEEGLNPSISGSHMEPDMDLKWTKESLDSWKDLKKSSESEIDKFLSTWKNPIFKYQSDLFATSKESRKISTIGAAPLRFRSSIYRKMRVLGQVDQKFIAVLARNVDTSMTEETKCEKCMLLLFDQHAVHERIRLENLINDNFPDQNYVISSELKTPIDVSPSFLDQIEIIDKYREIFRTFGLEFPTPNTKDISTISKTQVNTSEQNLIVTHVPSCFILKEEKSKKGSDEFRLGDITANLINEIIDTIKQTRGGGLAILPRTIGNVLNSEACRGAVKFGDSVSLEECESLMKDLQTCNAPFQCAHGRPSIAPIVDLDQLKLSYKIPKKPAKLNFKQLGNH